jgi:hypothetical protein
LESRVVGDLVLISFPTIRAEGAGSPFNDSSLFLVGLLLLLVDNLYQLKAQDVPINCA